VGTQNEDDVQAPPDHPSWFRADQRAAVQDFWRVYEDHESEIQASTLDWLRQHLELRLAKPVGAAQLREQHQHSRAILARAVAGDHGFYSQQLEGAGRRYAELGVPFSQACDLAGGFRRQLLPHLVQRYRDEPGRLTAALQALDDFVDYGAGVVAQGYAGHLEALSRAREADLAITLDSIGDAVIVTDDAGRVERMNPIAERLTGTRLSECAGRPVGEIFRIEHEHTGEPAPGPVQRVVQVGVALTSHSVLVARDGSRRAIAHSGAPVRKENGQLRGVVLVFRDISDERRAQENLRQWERIFQNATWGVAVASASDLTFQAVNPAYANMHGYSVEDLVGAPVATLWAAETRTQLEGHLTRLEEEGRIAIEAVHVASDGRQFPVEIIASVIKDANDRACWLVANVQDITERKKLHSARLHAIELEAENRRIEEANRLKSEFLANMSHELRTPLNSVIGFAELLYDEQVGNITTRQREFMGEILAGGRHLLRLINEVLDLAKVEAGKLDLRPEPADLRQLVIAVVQALRAVAIERGIAVEMYVDAALGDVVVDHGRFKQMLYNYVSNALKYAPNGGRVSIRLTPEAEDAFRVEVEDNGIGVSSENAPRLFAAFQQLESGAGKRQGGAGLGLALTKRLAEAQGGRVGMRPAAAQGSVFFATLPRRPSSAARAAADLLGSDAGGALVLGEGARAPDVSAPRARHPAGAG
jgi:PAS domain S-box-containing protein